MSNATNIYSSYTGSTYAALEQAEAEYQDALSKKAWIDALLATCLGDNDRIEAAKYTYMQDAMAKVYGLRNTTTITSEATMLAAIENLSWDEENEQDMAVKAQAIAYIQNTHKISNDGGRAAIKAAIDALYAFYNTRTGTMKFADNTAKSTVERAITRNFVTKKTATKGTEETADAVTSARTAAKEAFEANAKKNGWVSLLLDEDDKTYLSVAREFVTETSDERLRPLQFTTGKYTECGSTGSTDVLTRLDLNGRYNFQFTWYPSQDSLTIRTAGWAKKNNNQAAWTDMNRTDNSELGKAAATNHTKKDTHWEYNLVKLTYLTPNHSEITVGSADYDSKINKRTVNTLIQIKNMDDVYVKTTLEPGVYFLSLVSNKKANANINDKNLVANFAGKGLVWANEETSNVFANNVQNFEHMPRTQWVIEQNEDSHNETPTVNIYNREFNGKFYAKRVQLYKGEKEGEVFAISYGSNMGGKLNAKDTLLVQKITDEDKYIGYKNLYKDSKYDPLVENIFALKYFNGLDAGNYVEISEDKPMSVNPTLENGMQFKIVPILSNNAPKEDKYGYEGDAAKQLYKIAYQVQVYAPGKAAQYVMADGENGYVLTTDAKEATTFYFKENNELQEEEQDAVCYYALVTSDDSEVSGVKHPSLVLSVEDMADNNIENSIATFAFDDGTNGLYRRLGKTIENDGFTDLDVNNAKFFMANEPTRFLYENSANRTAENGNGVAKDSLNFLGVINIADRPANSALPIFIDTAYVRNNTSKPLYMLAVRTNWVEGHGIIPCDDDEHGFAPDGTPYNKYTCPHAKPATPSYRTGSYLVALESDSALVAPNENPIKYQDKYRLAFVEAKHIADTLVIANSKYTGTEDAAKDSIIFTDKKNTVATFAFKIVEGSDGADFYLETANSDGETRYVRVHNGVPVLVENIADAAQFNLTMTEEEATSNDDITTSEVKVIAGNGQITIAGAAGKKVVVSNILGQVVANTVITSDNATIAAPQGIVVVAVEGEEAVKAIVK